MTGYSTTESGDEHAFFWSLETGMIDIGPIGGAYRYRFYLNNLGQVAGYAYISETQEVLPFVWSLQDGIEYLQNFGNIVGINDLGQMIVRGTFHQVHRKFVSFWSKETGEIDIGDFGGIITLFGNMNNKGEIIGTSTTSYGAEHAFYWSRETGMIDLDSSYKFHDIQTSSQAVDINNKTQIVGWYNRSQVAFNEISNSFYYDYYPRAFLWVEDNDGEMVDLGTLGGSESSASALAINNLAQIVGWSTDRRGRKRAFLWTKESGMISLDSSQLSYSSSAATSINNLGQVIGTFTVSGSEHAFLWTEKDGMIDLGTLGGSTSVATAINDLGQVVGWSTTEFGKVHAFSWSAETGMIDLGESDAIQSYAFDINNLGMIVGKLVYSDTGISHAFLWTEEYGFIDLGTLGGSVSTAFGLNDLGGVVGESTTTSRKVHGFIWSRETGMIDLGTLGGSRSRALEINNQGLVVGLSSINSGIMQAVLWDVSFPQNPISIDSNADFKNYGFPGDGSADSPYIIEGYEIKDAIGPLIQILDTNVYFEIRNNYLDGMSTASFGIEFRNVTNGNISNNHIINCEQGIRLWKGNDNNSIHNNTVANHVIGIEASTSSHTLVQGNRILNNSNGIGIYAESAHNTIKENIIHNNTYWGFSMTTGSFANTIHDNLVSNNSRGFYMFSVNRNNLTGNIIFNNSGLGVYLVNSDNNTFKANQFSFNNAGISVYNYSDNNVIEDNTFRNQNGMAIGISRYSYNNSVTWNNFFENNLVITSETGKQAADSSFSETFPNVFIYNYWSDWTSPDDEKPWGIVDIPYPLDGSAGNIDPNPRTTSSLQFIYIDKNADFGPSKYDFPGLGIPEHPFIIEGYNFVSDVFELIHIQDTDVNFIIRNNLLDGITNGNTGIFLSNVTNARVINNTILNTMQGIFLLSSDYNYLENNTAKNNINGFYLESSDANTLINNTATSNTYYGFVLEGSDANNLTSNTANDNRRRGFYLYSSSDTNTLVNNNANNNGQTGFYLQNSDANTLIGNTANSNTNNGVVLYSNCDGNTLSNNIAINNRNNYGFYVGYSSYSNTLINNTATDNGRDGFALYRFSGVNTLINNTATSNGQNGFYLFDSSSYNTLINNTATSNSLDGFRLISSNLNTLTNNTVTSNSHGVYLIGSNHNTLIENDLTANYGMYISNSKDTTIISNSITYDNTGIYLDSTEKTNITGNSIFTHISSLNSVGIYTHNANFSYILSNTVIYTDNYAIHLSASSSNATVVNNTFFEFSVDSVAGAYDDGQDNVIVLNLWTGWTSPDANQDGIVDIPRAIDGYAGNYDWYPLAIATAPVDADGDSLSNLDEVLIYETDPTTTDTDGDGLWDNHELNLGTDPLNSDTDSDGLEDGWEVFLGTDPLIKDTDGDGLGDGWELYLGTDPLIKDTDGDELGDGVEVVFHGTDPLKNDTDGDGLTDWEEIHIYRTDPLVPDNSISGYVTDDQGTPLAFIEVTVYQEYSPGEFEPIGSAVTDINGYYEISLPSPLPQGIFEDPLIVKFYDPRFEYLPEYYDDTPLIYPESALRVEWLSTVNVQLTKIPIPGDTTLLPTVTGEPLFETTIIIPETGPILRWTYSYYIAKALRTIGIEASIVIMPWEEIFSRIIENPKAPSFTESGWDMFLVGFGAGPSSSDPSGGLWQLFNSTNQVPVGYNLGGYQNERVDNLLNLLESPPLFATDRFLVIDQLQQILIEEVPISPLLGMTNEDGYHGFQLLMYNLYAPTFQDKYLRQAIDDILPRNAIQELAASLDLDYDTFLSNSLIDPSSPEHDFLYDIGYVYGPWENVIHARWKLVEAGYPVLNPFTPSGPITIVGDTDFHTQASLAAWKGTGTVTDPYLIENLSISSSTSHLISIIDTTLHFVLQNCYLDGVTVTSNYGIYLGNVTNGLIRDNLIKNVDKGIHVLSNSHHNSVIFNIITDSTYGISLATANHTKILSNTITTIFSAALHLDHSIRNTLAYNDLSQNLGVSSTLLVIYLNHSDGNNLTHNVVRDYLGSRILLESSRNNDLIGNLGIWFSLVESDNNTLTNNTAYRFDLKSSSNNTLASNTITHVFEEVEYISIGFTLSESHNNTLSRNILTISFPFLYIGPWYLPFNLRGFTLFESHNNTLSGNILALDGFFYTIGRDNGFGFTGFSLSYSHNNTLSGNTLTSTLDFLRDHYVDFESNAFSFTGFSLSQSHNNTLSGNTLTFNIFGDVPFFTLRNSAFIYTGFSLSYSHNNTLSGNTFTLTLHRFYFSIYDVFSTVDFSSVSFNHSHNNTLSGNTLTLDLLYYHIYDEFGSVLLSSVSFNHSHNNTLSGNIFITNTLNDIGYAYAIKLLTSINNTIVANNFFMNILPSGGSQVQDEGLDNIFMLNYWSDFTSPDNDGDGLVDYPYPLDGTTVDFDPYPRAEMGVDPDWDGDGLSNVEEVKLYNSDPTKPDTDEDGLTDWEEVKIYGTDPLADVDTYTQTGSDVVVYEENSMVEIQFDSIIEAGVTTVVETTSIPESPSYFLVLSEPPLFFSISTTAVFEGEVNITFPYTKPNEWLFTHVYHYNATSGLWERIPTTYDADRQVLIATTTSFSLFGVFETLDVQTPVTLLDISVYAIGTTTLYVDSTSVFTLTAVDDYSGVDYIEYKINEGAWLTYVSPFSITTLGQHTISFRAVDRAGNVETSQSITIIVNAIELTYNGDLSGEYSDLVTVSATVRNLVTQEPLAGKVVQLSVGSQSVTLLTDQNGFVESTIILTQPNGTYFLEVSFTGEGEYLPATVAGEFRIYKEIATSSYTGTTIATTHATDITLRATVLDADDGYWGDLSQATASFFLYTAPIDLNNPFLFVSSIPVSPTGTPGVGVATLDVPNLAEGSYIVYVQLEAAFNNYYDGPWSDAVVLTIYEPTGEFVTGGGWIVDPAGSKGNFGFNVRFLKNGRVQGQSIYVYRVGEWEIIVKSNAWSGLAIEDTHAFFEGKAVVQMFNSKTGDLVWDEGNYQFRVDVWENVDGSDVYQIRIYDKNGLVFHDAGFSPLGELGGGHIAIHRE
ncbi:MAG: NosD domain-containing protein [Candidatus Hodarchaeales archaeon]